MQVDTIYNLNKTQHFMACACKSGSSSKQVTSVKQVVKKPVVVSSANPQRKALPKRVIHKRNF